MKLFLTQKYRNAQHGSHCYRHWDEELTNIALPTYENGNEFNIFVAGNKCVEIGITKNNELYFHIAGEEHYKNPPKFTGANVQKLIEEYTVWIAKMIQNGYLKVEV